MQQTQLHRFSSLLKSCVLYAHKLNCIQKPLIQNHLGSIHPVPLTGSSSHANTFNRSLVLNPTLLFFQLFSTSQTASNAVIPTASAHNYSSTPHHNSMPPHSHVINLHAHLVAAAMHSFLYNISHTPKERSPHALPCSSNGETTAEKRNG
jgi:hypothetical protein